MKHVFSGTLVHSTKENMMDICKKRLIGVDSNGKVTVSLFCLNWSKIKLARVLPVRAESTTFWALFPDIHRM